MLADATGCGSPPTTPFAEPTVFGRAGGQILGFYHPPVSVRVGPAVVICNPLGYEAMSAHRSLRHLAQRLAAAGLPTLRFDYRGTGDSSGHAGEPGRIEAWIEDIRSAVRELQSRSAALDVALVGIRFGAVLAMMAASRERDVGNLVAWAPIVSGRAFARELRAFRSLKSPGARRADGGEEVGGYLFAKETLDDLATIDLLTRVESVGGRLLIVPRGDGPSKDEIDLVARGRAAGLNVGVGSSSGYAAMMRDDPYDSVVPIAALDAIVAWLSAGGRSRGGTAPTATRKRTVLSLTAPSGGEPLKETAIRFGEGRRLFGIVAEPGGPLTPDRPAIVLLNVGADPHVGPHRMNVEHARELASMGYLSLRFDAGGLGESLATPGARENRLYDIRSVDDVKSAMTMLSEERGIRRFVLVGLCSGAFVAYHTAASDLRVAGQVLVNMFAFDWKEGDPVAPFERQDATCRAAPTLARCSTAAGLAACAPGRGRRARYRGSGRRATAGPRGRRRAGTRVAPPRASRADGGGAHLSYAL